MALGDTIIVVVGVITMLVGSTGLYMEATVCI